jgi:hypothetical protein
MEHEPRTAVLPADTGSPVKPDRLLLLRTMVQHGDHNQIVYNLRHVPEPAGLRQDWDQKRFQWPNCLSQEAMFLSGRRISLSWIVHGKQVCQRRQNVILGRPSPKYPDWARLSRRSQYAFITATNVCAGPTAKASRYIVSHILDSFPPFAGETVYPNRSGRISRPSSRPRF